MAEYAPTIISECLRIVVCTRNRNWNNDEYKQGVIEPYDRVQKLQDQLEKEGKQATREQMLEALEMLKTVFKTKKTPLEEQIRRFNEIFDKTGQRSSFPDFRMPAEADAAG